MSKLFIIGLTCLSTVSGFMHQSGLSLRKSPVRKLKMSSDEFTIAILGDLHLDPRFMDDHIEGREHFLKILGEDKHNNKAVVSLGDLGESKPVVEGSSELFAGTTGCLKLAREYLDGYKVLKRDSQILAILALKYFSLFIYSFIYLFIYLFIMCDLYRSHSRW